MELMITSFPLESAFLCLDCESVIDSAEVCSCGSKAVYPLAKFINRKQAGKHTCGAGDQACTECIRIWEAL
jgi:hypothetical protein